MDVGYGDLRVRFSMPAFESISKLDSWINTWTNDGNLVCKYVSMIALGCYSGYVNHIFLWPHWSLDPPDWLVSLYFKF